jgi:hypothetical protein
LLLLAACAAAGGGCKKEKLSLLLVNLRLAEDDPRAADLVSVTLTATPGPTATYPLTTALSATTSLELGLYIAATGDVSIVANAVPAAGCIGFRGSSNVAITEAGVTRPVAITMRVENTCPPDGGGGTTGGGGSAGGTGGGAAGSTAGTTGAGGTGGSGAGTGGGAAGTGGGAAGAGGASAGRGGSSGGGTTGTGGTAGFPSVAACRSFPHGATSGCSSTEVKTVAVSPDGQMVLSGGDDGRIKVWSFDGRTLTATTTVLTGLTCSLGSSCLAFSPDGSRIAYTTSSSQIRQYLVANWAPGTTLLGGSDGLVGVAFTPDGQRIISVSQIGFAGGDVFVHDLNTALPAVMKRTPDEPYALAVSPKPAADGSTVIAVGSWYGSVQIMTLKDSTLTGPTVLLARDTTKTVYSLRFSPDGTALAEGEDYGAIRFWASPFLGTSPVGNLIAFAGDDSVYDLAFSPDSRFIAAGGAFYMGQLSIYNAMTHAEVDRWSPSGSVNALAFTPSGGALLAGMSTCGAVYVCN